MPCRIGHYKLNNTSFHNKANYHNNMEFCTHLQPPESAELVTATVDSQQWSVQRTVNDSYNNLQSNSSDIDYNVQGSAW